MIRIRRFRNADVRKAGNVVKRAQRLTLAPFYPPAVVEHFCERNNPNNFLERAKERDFFVAEDGDRIIGLIARKGNELRTFYVDPAHQGRGIGRKLYERFKREALKHGHTHVKVSSSPYAVPIYAALGFRKIRRVKKAVGKFIYWDTLMEQELEGISF